MWETCAIIPNYILNITNLPYDKVSVSKFHRVKMAGFLLRVGCLDFREMHTIHSLRFRYKVQR